MIKPRRVILGFCIAGWVLAQSSEVSPSGRTANWKEDLRVFATRMSAHQKDFSKLYHPAAFRAEVASIERELPGISDAEVLMRLTRLIATAGVAHNGLDWARGGVSPLPEFRYALPLTFEWYSDGLAVTGASAEYTDILGARIIGFGGFTIDQVMQKITPYVSHETENGLKNLSPPYLVFTAALKYLGLADEDGAVSLTVAKRGGPPVTRRVQSTDKDPPQTGFMEALHIKVPVFLSRSDNYWYQFLADGGTLYIQYNQCLEDPGKPFEGFIREIASVVDSHDVRRLVIDLRHNPGGPFGFINGAITDLRTRLGRLGKVYVLIGPGTFSATVAYAVELHYYLHATLAGETAGETVGMYIAPQDVTFPHSQITLTYTANTAKYPRWMLAALPGPANAKLGPLDPDLSIRRTVDDALNGRDPVLDAVISR